MNNDLEEFGDSLRYISIRIRIVFSLLDCPVLFFNGELEEKIPIR